jgi:uncharacterized zinc-type alcohol dehydrogenase-like protein
MIDTLGYAAPSADEALAPFSFQRRDLLPDDVRIDIQFCGVCHSDLHTARGQWGPTNYPCVPGHEIVGRVAEVGSAVTGFKAGDLVGVGCLVDSCGHCASCKDGLEQFCEVGFTGTYDAPDKHTGKVTYGGYSKAIVVTQDFVLRMPEGIDLAAAAPLLCAGITTWSPLRHWKAGPGKRVGVVGLGGLGHMGLKLARAMGAEVVLFTTSPGKRDDALAMGAHEVVISKDAAQMEAQAGRFDLILDTVSAAHDLDPYIAALKRDGAMVLLGAPDSPHPSPTIFNLIMGRKSLAGSLIGGIAETQEMLDFCGANGITCDVEMIPMQDINTAYERMLKSDVKYRFVIDMASLDAAA